MFKKLEAVVPFFIVWLLASSATLVACDSNKSNEQDRVPASERAKPESNSKNTQSTGQAGQPGEVGIGDVTAHDDSNPTDELGKSNKMGSKDEQHGRSATKSSPTPAKH